MRVVLVTPFTPPLLGGVERTCLDLCRGLIAAGHRVEIVGQFCRSHTSLRQRFRQGEPARSLMVEGIPIHIIQARWIAGVSGVVAYALIWQPLLRRAALPLIAAAFGADLRRLLATADLVHYIGTGAEPLGVATAAAVSGREAALCMQPLIHPGQWGDRRIDAMLYRRADCVLVYSRSEAALVERLGVARDRIRPVSAVIDPPSVSNAAAIFRKCHGIDGPLVLFLGRKTRDKGIDLLLAAWPAVQARIPAAALAILGPGHAERPRGADPGRVIELSAVSESQKHEALAACSLLCVPSAGESLGIAMLEACAHGKPVVAADLPALRETVGAAGAGLLVERTPAALAEALITLLTDAGRRTAMGERGRHLAASMTHERMLAGYLQAYAAARGRRVAR